MKVVISWIAELLVGALPMMLFFINEGLRRAQSATLICKCADIDSLDCIGQPLKYADASTTSPGKCRYLLPDVAAEA